MNKVQKLEELVRYHKALYYQGRPEISDYDYDKIEEELRKNDPKNRALEIVGSDTLMGEKVEHEKKMLSLEKTYTEKELIKWIHKRDVVAIYKIDGVSCSLIYQDGIISIGKTRGDGKTGENITSKVLWISSIPNHIHVKEKIEVRGEIFCTLDNFIKLGDEMHRIGLEMPSSARNIVAGLMGRKDNIELSRYLSFMAFDIISEQKTEAEIDKFTLLKDLNFQVPMVFHCHESKDVTAAIDSAREFMDEGDYQIDGLVFSYNQTSLHEKLGETAHHPRYKIAFKFEGETRITKINGITWGVSRNGILTPVAQVEPVTISGAEISNVTLHNYGMVREFSLKKGDEIEIVRSGEVIPKFLRVVNSFPGEIEIPDICPSCFSSLESDEIRLYCRNQKCPEKNKLIILNFIQKIGIDDLSEKRLEEMIRKGLVGDIPDVYKLSIENLLTLGKTKEKLASKLFENIQKTKEVDLVTFLASLGISGGAYNSCEKIVAGGFNSIEKIESMKVEDLVKLEGFAEKSAQDFVSGIKERHDLIRSLLALGFKIENKRIFQEGILSGLTFCITGDLSIKRNEMIKLIKSQGGEVSSSVSKNTNFVLTNKADSTSSKYKKALELKIPIITEDELYKLIDQGKK